MKVELSRGYACEFKEEQASTTEIDVLGNYSKSGYNATPIVGTGGGSSNHKRKPWSSYGYI